MARAANRFRQCLFEAMHSEGLPACVCDLQCRVLWASEAFHQLAGVAADRTPGWSMLRMLAPETLDEALYQLRRSCSGEAHGFTLRCAGSDGQPFRLLIVTFPLDLDDGRQGFGGLAMPATDEDAAPLSDGLLFRRAAESMAGPVAFTDPRGVLLWANPAYYRATLSGWETTLGGMAPHLAENTELFETIRNAAANGEWQGEVRLDGDGGTRPWLLHIGFTRAAAGRSVWVHSLTDIGAWHAQREHLEFMALHDPMTQLPNRESFNGQLKNALFRVRREGTDLAVLFIDLDGFKQVNDTAGHLAGDRVLQQAAWRMNQVAGRHDFPLARLGGDEFAALIVGRRPLEAAAAAAEDLREALQAEFTCEGRTFSLSASIGIAAGRASAEDLLRRADAAMYRVKELGGDGVRTDSTTEEVIEKKPAMSTAMKISASPSRIELDELQAYFQPVVNLQTGEIPVLEARLRRIVDGSRVQSAAEVFKQVSGSGQHGEIDCYVLEMAAHGHSTLNASLAPRLPIAVNLTAATMGDAAALDMLDETLKRTALPPDLFRLEVPESAVLAHEPVLERMRRWAGRGYALGIDHATSNACFDAAVELGATVKFSEDMLEKVPEDSADAAQLKALIAQAAARKLTTAIEGVNRLEQLEFLKEIGCNEGQGLLVSKPRPMPQLVFLVKQGRCW